MLTPGLSQQAPSFQNLPSAYPLPNSLDLSLNYFGHFPKSNLPSQKTKQRNVVQALEGIPKGRFQNSSGTAAS